MPIPKQVGNTEREATALEKAATRAEEAHQEMVTAAARAEKGGNKRLIQSNKRNVDASAKALKELQAKAVKTRKFAVYLRASHNADTALSRSKRGSEEEAKAKQELKRIKSEYHDTPASDNDDNDSDDDDEEEEDGEIKTPISSSSSSSASSSQPAPKSESVRQFVVERVAKEAVESEEELAKAEAQLAVLEATVKRRRGISANKDERLERVTKKVAHLGKVVYRRQTLASHMKSKFELEKERDAFKAADKIKEAEEVDVQLTKEIAEYKSIDFGLDDDDDDGRELSDLGESSAGEDEDADVDDNDTQADSDDDATPPNTAANLRSSRATRRQSPATPAVTPSTSSSSSSSSSPVTLRPVVDLRTIKKRKAEAGVASSNKAAKPEPVTCSECGVKMPSTPTSTPAAEKKSNDQTVIDISDDDGEDTRPQTDIVVLRHVESDEWQVIKVEDIGDLRIFKKTMMNKRTRVGMCARLVDAGVVRSVDANVCMYSPMPTERVVLVVHYTA